MRLLMTGHAGFVGSHVAEHILKTTEWQIVSLVSFRHKGCALRIHGDNFDASRVELIYHDLNAPISDRLKYRIGEVDAVLNIAADSHVDRSIVDPVSCITNNVNLILHMLEYARWAKPRIFLQVSTDEVYGPAAEGHNHKEWETHLPSNPYSASKACQEDIAFAYWRTYGVPVVISNTMNIFGERQDKEKFVPMTLSKALLGETVQIHSGKGKPGSRFYLHARNQADALVFLLRHYGERAFAAYSKGAKLPLRYHVVGEREVDNLEMARLIAGYAEKPLQYELTDFHASRPGHDLRYALDGGKLAKLGWKAPVGFEESLRRTVDWSLAHPEWLALPDRVSAS